VDRILAEWRDAELRLDDQLWNTEQEALVEQLRIEYTEALTARIAEAEELSRAPEPAARPIAGGVPAAGAIAGASALSLLRRTRPPYR
jgi:hypothetical protein